MPRLWSPAGLRLRYLALTCRDGRGRAPTRWHAPPPTPRPPATPTPPATPSPTTPPVPRPQLVGMRYLHDVLKPVINRVFEEKKYMELDPGKMDLGRAR